MPYHMSKELRSTSQFKEGMQERELLIESDEAEIRVQTYN